MAEHTLTTCPICERPIQICAGYGGRVEKQYMRKEGAVVTIGYSRGGWGHRRDWIDFSGEICGECFDELGRLLEPAATFLCGERGRREHHVPPVWGDEPSPEGR